jgi:chromosome segregation ATPase
MSDLTQRIEALELALNLPNEINSSAPQGNQFQQEQIAKLEKQLEKANYRILHLTQNLRAKSDEVEKLKKQHGSS